MAVLTSMISYFDVNRSKASGVSMTLRAIGPIITPPLIEILQKTYDPDGCLLIFAGLGFNIFVVAAILQPIQWHMRKVPIEEDSPCQTNLDKEEFPMVDMMSNDKQTTNELEKGFQIKYYLNKFLVITPKISCKKSIKACQMSIKAKIKHQ